MKIIELFENAKLIASPEFLQRLHHAVAAYTSNNHDDEAGTAGRAFILSLLSDARFKQLTYTGPMYRMMAFEGEPPSIAEVVAKGANNAHSFSKTMGGLEDFLDQSGDVQFGDDGNAEYITDVTYKQTGTGIDTAAVYQLFKHKTPEELNKLNIHPQLFSLERAAGAEEVIAPYDPSITEQESKEINNPYFGDEDDEDW